MAVKRKKCKAVMLPTKDMSSIYVDNYIGEMHKISPIMFDTEPYMDSKESEDCGLIHQHLYITSDDEIKEGDVKHFTCNNGLINIITKQIVKTPGIYRKIIATTDKSLIRVVDGFRGEVIEEFVHLLTHLLKNTVK